MVILCVLVSPKEEKFNLPVSALYGDHSIYKIIARNRNPVLASALILYPLKRPEN